MATHVLTVPDWTPTSVNTLLGCHWARRSRRKRQDRDLLAVYARPAALPAARGKRRVSVTVSGWQHGGRLPDADNLLKSLLDALVAIRLLVDDGPGWCELGQVEVVRGRRQTVIALQDVE